ncbi:maltokinase N-terminal cap-like domain-containing protein [Streptomyces sp. NPDC003697]
MTEIARCAGWSVTEALTDASVVGALARRILAGGDLGALRFQREREDLTEPFPVVPVRPLGVEQSNSSVVIGDRLLLKVFRRPATGLGLDLEVQRLLTAAGSADTPALFGSLEATTDEGTATLAVLQHYLPGAVDGWTAAAGTPDFEEHARELGRVVARLHEDLAAHGPTAALDTTVARRIGRSLHSRLTAAVDTVPGLRPFDAAIREVYDRAQQVVAGAGITVQRVHGDLHLGQVIHAGRRWLAVDFEGEPAATQAEREALHPVAKDIAGMLRSFDYRALADLAEDGAADDTVRRRAAARWAARASEAFCTGYAQLSGQDPRRQHPVLTAYEIDKAVYELSYEVRHRPHLAWIPRQAVVRLARRTHSRQPA